jgi:predicted phage terminase large subunit-like protein
VTACWDARRARRALVAGLLVAAVLQIARCSGQGPEWAMAGRDVLEQRWHALDELKTRQAEASFREFARQAWPILEPGKAIVWNWHIEAKCDVLQAVTEGHVQHVIINEPPRNSKSTTLTLWHAWEWGPAMRPGTRWVTGAHKSSLATRDARLARNVMQSPWYRRRWGHRYQFTTDQNVKSYFENDARGRRIAFGLDAGVTGEGGNRLLVDDPLDLKKARNQGAIARINDLWDTSLFSRVDDQHRDAKILCGQRYAKGDLYDHVKDQHDWTWLRLPAEFIPLSRTRIVLRRDQCRFWVDQDGTRQREVIGTAEHVVEDPRQQEGELLNPGRFDAAAQATLRKQGADTYAAQQQQHPVDAEGKIVKRAWIRYFHPEAMPRQVDGVYLSWDTAVKAKTSNDRWAGQAWVKQGADVWLMRSVCDRLTYPEGRDAVRALYAWAREKFPTAPIYVLIENTASGPDLQIDLKRLVPGLVPVKVDGDKERRLRAVSPMFEAGNVFVPGRAIEDGTNYDPALTPIWAQEFIDEVCGYSQAATVDDRVDACSQALARIQAVPVLQPPPTSGGSARADVRM